MTNIETQNLVERLLQTAYYYREGKHVEENKEIAKLLYTVVLSIDNTNNRALSGLAWCHEEYSDTFIEYCEKSAVLGNKWAQGELGDYYISNGEYNNAINWYIKASDNGNESASYSLAFIALCREEFKSFDKNKALSIAQELYKSNRRMGSELLGKIHYYSVYKELLDHGKAIEYFKEAAILGSNSSAWYVGNIYKEGNIPNRNPYDAIVWFEKAGRTGDNDGYTSLRRIYLYENEDRHLDYNDEELLKLMEGANEASPEFCWHLMEYYEYGTLGKIDYRLSKHYRDKYIEYLNALADDKRPLQPKDVINQFNDFQNLRNLIYNGFLIKWVALANHPDARLEVMREFEEDMNNDRQYSLETIRTLAQLYAGNSSPIYELIEDAKSEKMHLTDFTYSKHDIPNTIQSISPDGIPIDYKKAFELLDKGIELGDKGCEIILTNLLEETLEVLRNFLN